MLFYILIILAVVIAVLETTAAGSNEKVFLKINPNSHWGKAYRWRWLIGLPFAALPAFIQYPLSGELGTFQIIGFPLAVAATDEAGLDYTGVYTTAFFMVNALIWYFAPHLILYLWNRIGRKG